MGFVISCNEAFCNLGIVTYHNLGVSQERIRFNIIKSPMLVTASFWLDAVGEERCRRVGLSSGEARLLLNLLLFLRRYGNSRY